MKISIIIPALNEEKAIAEVIKQVPKKKLEKEGYVVEIIVVDNASTDNTASIAHTHGATVVHQPLRGYGNAYKAGFDNATGDIIVTGDADMTYPFDHIPHILSVMAKKGIQFMNTDRLTHVTTKSMHRSHIWANKVLTILTKFLFRWPFKDSQSGMWIFHRNIWQYLNVRSRGMPFSQELKIEAFVKGFLCAEIPISYRPRIGKVKLNSIKDGITNVSQLFLKRLTLLTPRELQLREVEE